MRPLDRPALQVLLSEIQAGKIDVVVVYKVDRLTRSLADFAKLVELFDQHGVSFVSITQSFNTTTSMGRLTLNVLLSFAQFEREVIGERVRDKIAASKRKGIWVGGPVPLGYLRHRNGILRWCSAQCCEASICSGVGRKNPTRSGRNRKNWTRKGWAGWSRHRGAARHVRVRSVSGQDRTGLLRAISETITSCLAALAAA